MTVIHYTGNLISQGEQSCWDRNRDHIANAIAKVLKENGVQLAVGSLACGADLLIAEQAKALGSNLHIFLPYEIEKFRITSVAVGGQLELERFDSLISQADTVTILPGWREYEGQQAYRRTSVSAIASAMTEAHLAGCAAFQLAVWNADKSGGGTDFDISEWTKTGNSTVHISTLDGTQRRSTHHIATQISEKRIANVLLGQEIKNAWRAANQELAEASVFYAARILESLLNDAIRKLGISKKPLQVYAMIEELFAARKISSDTYTCMHLLRHAGNEMRHLNREPGRQEQWAALSLARRILLWFAVEAPHGPGLPLDECHLPESPLDKLIESLLRAQNIDSFTPLVDRSLELIQDAPSLGALAVERAIELGSWNLAQKLLDALRGTGALHRRVLELQALIYSRSGNPEKAVKVLSRLETRKFDLETPGIMAGGYKRIWMAGKDPNILRKAYKFYRQGHRATESVYLGINAAACASWLGDDTESRRIAASVHRRLTRQARHWAPGAADIIHWDFYSLAIMAEALWLLGDYDQSEEWQAAAINSLEARPSSLDAFKTQMALHRACKDQKEAALRSL